MQRIINGWLVDTKTMTVTNESEGYTIQYPFALLEAIKNLAVAEFLEENTKNTEEEVWKIAHEVNELMENVDDYCITSEGKAIEQAYENLGIERK